MDIENNTELPLSNFSILVVEDDLSFSIELDMLIQEVGYIVKGRVDNSTDALNIILSKDPPDLILMDIQIRGAITGLELAEQIKDTNIPILFISTIEEEETYNRARDTNFVGYLVKPVNKYSIRTAIDLAVQKLVKNAVVTTGKSTVYCNATHLFFKKRGVFYKIPIMDVLYVQADGDQTITYTKERKFYSFISLRILSELLEDFGFIQIHRSYLANIKQASTIDIENQMLCFNQIKIPFSRRKKVELFRNMPHVS